jgi:hypothetical protein
MVVAAVRQDSLHKRKTKTPNNAQVVSTLRKRRKEERKK